MAFINVVIISSDWQYKIVNFGKRRSFIIYVGSPPVYPTTVVESCLCGSGGGVGGGRGGEREEEQQKQQTEPARPPAVPGISRHCQTCSTVCEKADQEIL